MGSRQILVMQVFKRQPDEKKLEIFHDTAFELSYANLLHLCFLSADVPQFIRHYTHNKLLQLDSLYRWSTRYLRVVKTIQFVAVASWSSFGLVLQCIRRLIIEHGTANKVQMMTGKCRLTKMPNWKEDKPNMTNTVLVCRSCYWTLLARTASCRVQKHWKHL